MVWFLGLYIVFFFLRESVGFDDNFFKYASLWNRFLLVIIRDDDNGYFFRDIRRFFKYLEVR